MNSLRCEALPPLPDPLGFAGMFGGISHGTVLCAGGANFSDTPMAKGGTRVWHDDVYALPEGGAWRIVGKIPAPRGYGVSGSWRGSVAMVGGNDGKRAVADGCLVRWDGKSLHCERLPDLPVPITGACGTVVGDDLIVAGGQSVFDGPSALARCFACNLAASSRTWRELPWPEGAPGRVLAVAGTDGRSFYLFTGAALSADSSGKPQRRYLTDAWRFHSDTGWECLADLPRPAAAGPAAVPWLAKAHEFVLVGGIWAEYLAAADKKPVYPGFSRDVLVYSPRENRWRSEPPLDSDVPGRLVAPCMELNGDWIIATGEIRPGHRTVAVERWVEVEA